MRIKLGRVLCIFMLVLTLCSLFSVNAFASGSQDDSNYYLSFKKYKEAVNPDGSRTITYNDVTDQISNLLNEGLRRYQAGTAQEGDDGYYKPFTNSYGFWYETSGFEKTVMGYISGARVNEVELQFSNMKKAVNNGASPDEVKVEVDKLVSMLREDANILDGLFGYSTGTSDGSGSSAAGGLAAATFAAVFGIILREGLEAILIIGAIVAYLIKTNNKKRLPYVYVGALLAVAASVVLAIILYNITSGTSNSIPQEIVEGVTALVAVVVMIYVSNWMISKVESEAWTKYITEKVSSSAEKGKMFALGFTSFLVVFREGAEVILFCQQYFSRAGSMEHGFLAVFGGIALGLLAVAIIFILIRVFGVKIPLKPFFFVTSIFMAVMAIAFLGAGMWELFLDGGLAERIGGVVQSLAGTIPELAWMSGNDVLAFFGIYPTWITLGPQIILLIITVITFIAFIVTTRKATAKKAAVQENAPAGKINGNT